MNKSMKLLIAGAALIVAGAAQAIEGLETPVERIQVAGLGVLPYQKIFEAVSTEGENMDAFAARIAPQLVDYSERTGFEACGVIGAMEGRYGVVVGTNHAHVACANFSAKMPEGMKSTGQTIHSHGNGAAKLNGTDLRFMGIPETARSRHMHGKTWGQDRENFSSQDLKSGPGYLARPSGTSHQDGRQVRVVDAI